MKNKALFFDRDGVVNIDKEYIYKIEDFSFTEGIFNLVKYAKNMGYLVIIVTNQSGIGRGFFTEEQFLFLNEWMIQEFLNYNILIDHVYFCSTHPTEGIGKYKTEDYRRKPNPGMILEAAQDYNIDLKKSILIGDRDTDMLAGKSSGIEKLFFYNNSKKFKEAININSLGEIIKYL